MINLPNLKYILLISSFLVINNIPVAAQITPDNTLGAESSRVVPNGNIDKIDGGALRDKNLFHSFKEFNINNGQSVYFNNPSKVENILTRVTGGKASNILGTLGVNGTANLFLINPNGIVLGENAILDMRGSFLGTTANSFVFGDGLEFSATNPQAPPLLTINVPIGLQFGKQPGSITTTSNQFVSLSGGTVALIGGEINVDGSTLFSQNGQVKLAAVGEDSTVGLNVNGSSLGFQFSEGVARESINVTNGRILAGDENSGIELFGGNIDINNSLIGGGSITIDGTKLNLDKNSSILTTTSGAINSGDIQIKVKDEVSLANSSFISSGKLPSSTGDGGDVTINARRITITGDETLENRSGIGTFTVGAGNGGNLTLDVTESVNINGGDVLVSTGSAGNAGDLTVRATNAVNITNQGILGLLTLGSGSTGNMRIETDTLLVQNSYPVGGISAIKPSSGSGSVGSITIQARNRVDVINGRISTFSEAGSRTQSTPGDITIETRRVNIKDGGSISTDTFSSANAANIYVKAAEYVDISGVSFLNSQISSSTGLGATGNGGNVIIESPRLSLSQGGGISTGSLRSSGNPGNITIRAKDVEIDGFVFVLKEQLTAVVQENFSDSLQQQIISSGKCCSYTSSLSSNVILSDADVRAGTITIDTERLRLSNGGNIDTSVIRGRGEGGDIVVRASDSINITGVGAERLDGSFAPSGLFTDLQTGGIGSGGSIDVTTGSLNLSNEGAISAATFNQGNAGNIRIAANRIDLRGSSNITTQVNDEATGNAGNLNIKTQLLNLQEESQVSSVTQGNGNGGNLTVEADTIILTGSESEFVTGLLSAVEDTGNGKGGDIDITTNRLFVRDNAEISSSILGNGEAGNINIIANFLEINGKGSGIVSLTNVGDGGDINFDIDNLLLLRAGGLISTTAGRNEAGGDGGNISINSPFIVAVPKEDSDISANAFTGSGGNVDIITQGIFGIQPRSQTTDESDITASSQTGIQGEISITDPEIDPSQGLIELPSGLVDRSNQIAQSCPQGVNAKRLSEFYITGKGSLPPNPLNLLEGTVDLSRLASLDGEGATEVEDVRVEAESNEIVEAQGFMKTENGEIYLVAQAPTANSSSHATASACSTSE